MAKTTIYRRWRDRDELALPVLIEMSEGFRAPPDLGDTRKELLAFVSEATQVIQLGGVIPGLASEIATDPDISRTYRERIIDVRLAEVEEIIDRGVARGDLRPGIEVRVAHELLIGPLMYRLLFTGALEQAPRGAGRRRGVVRIPARRYATGVEASQEVTRPRPRLRRPPCCRGGHPGLARRSSRAARSPQ